MDERSSSVLAGGDFLLDLGCGQGQFLDAIGARYALTVGIDLGTTRRPEGRSNGRQWSYVLADLDQGIPVRSSSADAVHANQVIEHVRNPLAFLSEAHRVLRNGGILVVTTPNVRYLPHLWRLLVRGQGPMTSDSSKRTLSDWDDGHIHFFTPTDLEWISQRVGFRSVRTSALVERSGRLGRIRRLLDRSSRVRLVKSFFSGNTLLFATKRQ